MLSNLARPLGKLFMPGWDVCITVYTLGGIDSNGNDIEEPIVFEGSYPDAVRFLSDDSNIRKIQRICNGMPDGYIVVEVGGREYETEDASEIMQILEEA